MNENEILFSSSSSSSCVQNGQRDRTCGENGQDAGAVEPFFFSSPLLFIHICCHAHFSFLALGFYLLSHCIHFCFCFCRTFLFCLIFYSVIIQRTSAYPTSILIYFTFCFLISSAPIFFAIRRLYQRTNISLCCCATGRCSMPCPTLGTVEMDGLWKR